MPTADNSKQALNTSSSDAAQQNYCGVSYGTPYGSINFAHLHKKGDVTAALLFQTLNAEHSFCMDADGKRGGWTTSIQPGHFQLECGSSSTRAEDSLMLNAKNGNICLNATHGNLRIEADSIELVARGEKTDGGNVKITASEKIVMDSKEFHVNAKNLYKIVSPKQGEIIANGVLKMYGSIIRGVTDAVAIKDSKVGGQKYQKEQQRIAK